MLSGAAPDTLVRYINRATQTPDIAIYNWNNTTILHAVNAAKTRGGTVQASTMHAYPNPGRVVVE